MISVTLTHAELLHAANIGAQRHIEALLDQLEDRHAAKRAKDKWGLHIEGAAGELAFARAIGQIWEGRVGNFKEADLGERVQVRTRSGIGACKDLIVREGDADTHAFALVTGCAPVFRVHGWTWGHEAKQRRWWADWGGHGGAYFVPSRFLRPIDYARAREAA